MRDYKAEFDWMPPPYRVPVRVKRSLEPFTPTRSGWTVWYRGKTRFVCARSVPLDEVAACWAKLKEEVDVALTTPVRVLDDLPLREALSRYFQFLEHRVMTGTPKPISRVSLADYQRTLIAFGRFEVRERKFADWTLSEIGPEHFQVYAEAMAKRSPTSLARCVATVRGFFSYCKREGLLAREPNFGSYFVRPPQSTIRDRRLRQEKSWAPEDLWTIIEHADVQEKAWIGLALSGAMDNADIAHLSFSLFDKSGMLLDYRRRKTGRVARLIPLHPMARVWLDEYLKIRPQPAEKQYADLVFLTPNGIPLQRTKAGSNGIGNHIDYVAHCWDRLLRRAGLRAKVKGVRSTNHIFNLIAVVVKMASFEQRRYSWRFRRSGSRRGKRRGGGWWR
ncbi:MAG: tyrosine-type recombinase/integrase, partial [Phycisphaerae bacterium]